MLSLGWMMAESAPDGDERNQIEHCIADLAAGDGSALSYLYDKTRAAVYGFALSIVKNRHDAEDILQDTYLRIHAAAGTYTPNGSPMPWILTITRNLALMKLRQRARTGEMPEEELFALPAPDIPPDEKLVLEQAMGLLGDEERQVVMLHAVAGFKHREIAQMLDLALPTVLSKYNRALKKLKTRLEGV